MRSGITLISVGIPFSPRDDINPFQRLNIAMVCGALWSVSVPVCPRVHGLTLIFQFMIYMTLIEVSTVRLHHRLTDNPVLNSLIDIDNGIWTLLSAWLCAKVC